MSHRRAQGQDGLTDYQLQSNSYQNAPLQIEGYIQLNFLLIHGRITYFVLCLNIKASNVYIPGVISVPSEP
jgi:hypothetical protein